MIRPHRLEKAYVRDMDMRPSDAGPTTNRDLGLPAARVLAAGLTAFRIYYGLVLLLNGLAKVFGIRNIELGPYRVFLIDRPFARGILQTEVFDKNDGAGTQLDFLRAPAQLMIDNWGVVGWLVTAVEVGAGLMLLLGVAARLGAAVGAAQKIGLALVYASSNRWLFEQPHEYVPLIILALVPSGRLLGLDGRLRERLGWKGPGWRGWPF